MTQPAKLPLAFSKKFLERLEKLSVPQTVYTTMGIDYAWRPDLTAKHYALRDCGHICGSWVNQPYKCCTCRQQITGGGNSGCYVCRT